MKSRRRFLLFGLLVLLISVVALLVTVSMRDAKETPTAGAKQQPESGPGQVPLNQGNVVSNAFGKLSGSPDRSTSGQSLKDLKELLATLSPEAAITEIRRFLDGGQDKPTGLSFEIDGDGQLKEWPTFRTFLLDALLAIDPAAAAEISRSILSSPTSADEWALALRNVGRAEDAAETRDFLRTKTEELIANPEWQADPSIGYLNAFDVLVHTDATTSTPLLSGLIQNKERKDLAHASFLTLDRLVQSQPADMLQRLAADPSLAASRPEMTAQQFARADLRDPAQQAIVKSWLLDPARSAAELNAFSGTYPNNNQFVSNNLLTRSTPTSGTDLAAHDREVLEIIRAWQNESAFQPVAEHLRTMTSRLEQFSKQ
jgi:hypothetical protein